MRPCYFLYFAPITNFVTSIRKMKTTKFYTVALLFVIVLACTNNKELNTFRCFEGNWQLENSSTFENWKNNGTFYGGQVLKIENTDTLLLEKLRIFEENNVVYYEATVASQNDGKPIRFKLTQQNNTEFQFENPEHDFPQKLIYSFENKNKLNAIISGGNKQATFTYTKVN